MCYTANLILQKSVFDQIPVPGCSGLVLSDQPVLDKSVGAFDATLETSNGRLRDLESLIAPKDAKRITKMAPVESWERRLQFVEEGQSQISATGPEHGLQLCAAEAARSSTDTTYRSIEYQLQVACSSESSLREEMGQLQSDETKLERNVS